MPGLRRPLGVLEYSLPVILRYQLRYEVEGSTDISSLSINMESAPWLSGVLFFFSSLG